MKNNLTDVTISSCYPNVNVSEMCKLFMQNKHAASAKNTECTQTTLCRGLDSSDNSINNSNTVISGIAETYEKRLLDSNTPEWERKELYKRLDNIEQMQYRTTIEHEEFIKRETNKQLALGIFDILGDALGLAVVYGVTSAVTYSFCGDSTQSSSQII